MRKLLSLSKVCLMALILVASTACTKNEVENDDEVPRDYIDLGLSSGTKWKVVNEKNAADPEYDFFTYDEAVAAFGDKLPSKEQCEELVNECSLTWTGSGCKMVGPNGKSISFPASGYRGSELFDVGSAGYYWSSTPTHNPEYAWVFAFGSDGDMVLDGVFECCAGCCLSVRLVED